MAIREDIIQLAKYWADPGSYRPNADELRSFFIDAGTEQVPTQEEAQKSLDTLQYGCYIGKQRKQWCGIFACAIARNAGLTGIKWTLDGGKILGSRVAKHFGHSSKIQPGDIGIIN